MDNIDSPDRDSPEDYWFHYAANQDVNVFLAQFTNHGPEWSETEITESVENLIDQIKQSLQKAKLMVEDQKMFKDFHPKKTKKKLVEYIKNNMQKDF